VTTKEACRLLQGFVSQFAKIDFREIHRYAFSQIDMETVRLIAKENTRKADAFIFLMGDLTAHRNSLFSLFSTAEPEVVLTFTYRYLLVLRYLTSAPPDLCLYLSSEVGCFLEQVLIDLFGKVEETVYTEIIALHADIQKKRHPVNSLAKRSSQRTLR
jgi:hypothetical protein